MRKRALVSHTRMPEIDRDSGSHHVDSYVRWLLEEGWSVTFIASDDRADPRHAHRLRQQGVPTFAGYDNAENLIATGDFELAILAFWEQASELLPILRVASPGTRVIVDSVDLHFLRDGRRLLAGTGLNERYGRELVGELNTYQAADAVLTVSEKEASLLSDFLGPERTYALPLAEESVRSPIPFEQRQGMFFVGNFRHRPNGEAVEYLCRDILPRLDPGLLAEHPLSVVGSGLDEKVQAHGRGLLAVKMIGWVPDIRPYLERARVSVVPLLHGAGVKRKIVQSLLCGTPVVTTPIGAEGLGLRSGEHAAIGESPGDLAAGIAHLLSDAEEWQRLADAGYELAAATHDPERVRTRFLSIVEEVLSRPAGEAPIAAGLQRVRRRELAYRDTVAAVRRTVGTVTDAGSTVLVVSKGDNQLVDLEGRAGAHFPQGPDGRWAGYHPADSATAVRQLEAQRDRGARYFVLPSTSFWWLHHYRELSVHLETNYRRIHSDEHLVMFDLGERARRAPVLVDGEKRRRVQVIGAYERGRAGPPPSLVAELDRSERFEATQGWRPVSGSDHPFRDLGSPGSEDADWILFVGAKAILPAGFLDDFLTRAAELAALGVERAQPAQASGPGWGPPVTERVEGIVAREVESVTPMPVLAVRGGAPAHGATGLIDAVPITLAESIAAEADSLTFSNVRDVFQAEADGPARAVQRSQGSAWPLISVLIATYDRPDLLSRCLEGFCDQTLPVTDFEVVVVDDGSVSGDTDEVLKEFAARLPITWTRINHSGRAAAKNLAALLARGEVMLFFDDDDLPATDLLEQHLNAHREYPDEGTAILGHTDWAPGLAVTPLMHYLTEVDRMLFSYGNLDPGESLDWRGFWEGRVSSKRSLHLRRGLHDQRLEYSIDVEMAWRLGRHGLRVVYWPAARSYMARPIDFDEFCERSEAKGRAQAAIARLHEGSEDAGLLDYLEIDGAREGWHAARPELDGLVSRIRELEAELGEAAPAEEADPRLTELHERYRAAFQAYKAKGIAESGSGEGIRAPWGGARDDNGRPEAAPPLKPAHRMPGESGGDGGEAPVLTVTMPVWSRTPELAEMAVQTVERVREVARLSTEIVVIDNGSPVQRSLPARVHRFEENRGVATAWNTGFELARAPVVAVLNSDCRVEPGWDEALYEAATTGERIAFPYTDHCDGLGFRQPDQAGTAGWCFMLTKALYREIGPFDERFNPAFCEDTDYWHRAWELGINLSPVPAARVSHARRTSTHMDEHSEWLLTSHRYLYGWKHGVDPMSAPPYYSRTVVEYHAAQGPASRASTT